MFDDKATKRPYHGGNGERSCTSYHLIGSSNSTRILLPAEIA